MLGISRRSLRTLTPPDRLNVVNINQLPVMQCRERHSSAAALPMTIPASSPTLTHAGLKKGFVDRVFEAGDALSEVELVGTVDQQDIELDWVKRLGRAACARGRRPNGMRNRVEYWLN